MNSSMTNADRRTSTFTSPIYAFVLRSNHLLNWVKNQPRFSGDGRSSIPQSAGLRVNALIDEKTVAVAMVVAN